MQIQKMLPILVFLLHVLGSFSACLECAEGEWVKLMNAADPCAGTVMVQMIDGFQTVCDSQWDMTDATVVCRQMGCGVPYSAPRGSTFGVMKTGMAITNVQCRGDETSLLFCPYDVSQQGTCPESRNAAVHCTGPDDIRLVNGDSLCSGRVEIRHNGVWGTVCDNSWDLIDASVVCKQLGCVMAIFVAYNATFGKSSLPVLMSNVQCRGDETALWKCPQQGWTSKTCPTGRDAGVTCRGIPDEVRLVNSGDDCAGRVEIRYRNQWGTVCDTNWDLNDANVVCKQLECGSVISADTVNLAFGKGTWPVRMSDFRCTGSEQSLLDCPHRGWGNTGCPSGRDSAVICTGSRRKDLNRFKDYLFWNRNEVAASLQVSADGKQLNGFKEYTNYPRFTYYDNCALGSVGFISGRYYWVLNVSMNAFTDVYRPDEYPILCVGVARQSAQRFGHLDLCPTKGFWSVSKYSKGSIMLTETKLSFKLREEVRMLGVYLDYEGGLLSFYNALSSEHIYTYTATFTDRVFPFACVGYKVQLKLQ